MIIIQIIMESKVKRVWEIVVKTVKANQIYLRIISDNKPNPSNNKSNKHSNWNPCMNQNKTSCYLIKNSPNCKLYLTFKSIH